MVVNFFAKPKKENAHGISAVNYLLNKRVQQGTARVIKGNELLTRQIINNIRNKEKLTVGCLSFEESNIDEKTKIKLMAEFEELLLPGVDKARYNSLWVEHTDKGRLELNFVIPKIDLKTGTQINPYWDDQHQLKVDTWKQIQNLKYNFTDPDDPDKKRNLKFDKEIKKEYKNHKELNEDIKNQVLYGGIKNREELIEYCKSKDIKVTRVNDNGMSLTLPGGKKATRYKEDIFAKDSNWIDIRTKLKEDIQQYKNRDKTAELRKLQTELIKHKEYSLKWWNNEIEKKDKAHDNRTRARERTRERKEKTTVQEPIAAETTRGRERSREDSVRKMPGGYVALYERRNKVFLSNHARNRVSRYESWKSKHKKYKGNRAEEENRTNTNVRRADKTNDLTIGR